MERCHNKSGCFHILYDYTLSVLKKVLNIMVGDRTGIGAVGCVGSLEFTALALVRFACDKREAYLGFNATTTKRVREGMESLLHLQVAGVVELITMSWHFSSVGAFFFLSFCI